MSGLGVQEGFAIEPYREGFLPDLYRVCLLTGDSGEDASGLYRDPELLGHFYAAPYPASEPGLTFVLTDAKGACGYVLGTRDSLAFERFMEGVWLPPLRRKYPPPPPDDASRDARMVRLLHKGYKAPPHLLERYPAHLHIDMLPRAQGRGMGRKLMNTFLDRLRELGVPGVHLGVGVRNQKAVAFYQRLGFARLETFEWGYTYAMGFDE